MLIDLFAFASMHGPIEAAIAYKPYRNVDCDISSRPVLYAGHIGYRGDKLFTALFNVRP